jgi:hypothetical protein
MAVFLEEVVFDLPGEVNSELIGEFDLREGVLEELQFLTVSPRAGKLMLVENPEFHSILLLGGSLAETVSPALREPAAP